MQFDETTSNLIATQFPEFYQQEGPAFITFVQAYYEFLDQNGITRNLLNVSDSDASIHTIGKSIDLFADSFKNQYLVNFPSISYANQSFILKNIQDFYKSKGSLASIKLLFQLLYGVQASTYIPGNDIIRASDGKWVQPYYLEVTNTTRNFIGKKITGSSSGATAYVESTSTSRVNGKFALILYLSNLAGNFRNGEFISENGNYQNAPAVTGSLSSIQITDGGANNAIGDILSVVGTYGAYGQVRVLSTINGSGRVSFNLLDGGTGYLNSELLDISSTVLGYSNFTGGFTQHRTIVQPLENIQFSAVTGTGFSIGQTAYIYNSSANLISTGIIVNVSNSTFLTISQLDGIITNPSYILDRLHTTNGSITTVTSANATGVVVGSNSSYVGISNVTNTFYSAGAYFYDPIAPIGSNRFVQTDTGQLNFSNPRNSNLLAVLGILSYNPNSIATPSISSYAKCNFISAGYGATASVGSISNTESITLYTDLFTDLNTGGVLLSALALNGSNSNVGITTATGSISFNTGSSVITGTGTLFSTQLTGNIVNLYIANTYIGTVNSIASNTSLTLVSNAIGTSVGSGYSFNFGQLGISNNPNGTTNTLLRDLLAQQTSIIGSISTFGSVNPGNNYNANPFTVPYNKYIAGYEKQDYIINISNLVGNIYIGGKINQSIIQNNQNLSYTSANGTFVVNNVIYQSTSNSYGIITFANTSILTLSSIQGNFTNGTIQQVENQTTSNVVSVSNSVSIVSAPAIITSANSSQISAKRQTFQYDITNQYPIVMYDVQSRNSGSANVVSVYADVSSGIMGDNAKLLSQSKNTTGVISSVQIINSGINYSTGDQVTLQNSNNSFISSGIAGVAKQGIGLGYWKDNSGKLNSDKYIHDNNYYQEFAYEVQTEISFNRYVKVLKDLVHISGFNLFGKVIVESTIIDQTSVSSEIITNSVQPVNIFDNLTVNGTQILTTAQ